MSHVYMFLCISLERQPLSPAGMISHPQRSWGYGWVRLILICTWDLDQRPKEAQMQKVINQIGCLPTYSTHICAKMGSAHWEFGLHCEPATHVSVRMILVTNIVCNKTNSGLNKRKIYKDIVVCIYSIHMYIKPCYFRIFSIRNIIYIKFKYKIHKVYLHKIYKYYISFICIYI